MNSQPIHSPRCVVGVIGGGMLVPLGAIYVDQLIVGDEADFNLVLFALGLGMALGVVAASLLQNHINKISVGRNCLNTNRHRLILVPISKFQCCVIS